MRPRKTVVTLILANHITYLNTTSFNHISACALKHNEAIYILSSKNMSEISRSVKLTGLFDVRSIICLFSKKSPLLCCICSNHRKIIWHTETYHKVFQNRVSLFSNFNIQGFINLCMISCKCLILLASLTCSVSAVACILNVFGRVNQTACLQGIQ